ncbi:MAG: hypothetical protein ACFWTQ_03875 [Lactococcus sp.]|jgi:hypothetical protein
MFSFFIEVLANVIAGILLTIIVEMMHKDD